MSMIRFDPLRLVADVRTDETILDAARRVGAPVGNSCGGIGICRRCRVTVVEGAERLGTMTTIERDQARLSNFAGNERLACQTIVNGDCVITTSYW